MTSNKPKSKAAPVSSVMKSAPPPAKKDIK